MEQKLVEGPSCVYLFSFATLREKTMEVATWGHL